MKTSSLAFIVLIAITLFSCYENQDPGPLQAQEKEFNITGFDKIDIGDALNVTVTQGSAFAIKVNGDRRNLDDLQLTTFENTLRVKFDNDRRAENRQYTTYVVITMPSLTKVVLSGAVTSNISGFQTEENAEIWLSGATRLTISGASKNLKTDLSGASELHAFDLETEIADIDASGASKVEILTTQSLKATASGASKIRYKGSPSVNAATSGASSIIAD